MKRDTEGHLRERLAQLGFPVVELANMQPAGPDAVAYALIDRTEGRCWMYRWTPDSERLPVLREAVELVEEGGAR